MPDSSTLPAHNLLARGERFNLLGQCYKLAGDGASVALAVNTQPPDVDANRMSVGPVIISTPTPDRVNDIVIPAGVKLDNYRKNPVVLWEHGFQLTTPIAKSEDADGNLTVFVDGDTVKATSYFSQSNKESEQIFSLLADKIIRATSVRFTPVKSTIRRTEDGEYYVIDECDLEEWSWVGIPCNPEACREIIAKNRLAGSQIAEPILKSLASWAPPKPIQVRGHSLKDADMTQETKAAVKKLEGQLQSVKSLEAAKLLKPKLFSAYKADGMDDEDAMAKADEAMDEAEKRLKEEPAPGETTPESTPEDDTDTDSIPLGAQVLSAVHTSLSEMLANIEAAMGPLENPDVKAFIEEQLGILQGSHAAFEGKYSTAYPDAPALTKADSEEAAVEEEAVKSWLRSAISNQMQLAGLGARVKQLAKSKGLKPAERKLLADTVKHLERITAQAKSSKDNAVEAAVKQFREDLAAMKAKLDSAIPANRR